jgi:hypothetical protein
VNEKLDPALEAIVETAGATADRVDVLVGLDVPADDPVLADLTARGLAPRANTGTVLTGSIATDDVARLAESPHVVKIEASAPLHPEQGEGLSLGE